jgi:hypothetical protein
MRIVISDRCAPASERLRVGLHHALLWTDTTRESAVGCVVKTSQLMVGCWSRRLTPTILHRLTTVFSDAQASLTLGLCAAYNKKTGISRDSVRRLQCKRSSGGYRWRDGREETWPLVSMHTRLSNECVPYDPHTFPPGLRPKRQEPTPNETAVVAELMGDQPLVRVLGIDSQDVKRASETADGHRRDH